MSKAGLALAFSTVVGLACGGAEPPVGTVTVTGLGLVANDQAVGKIALERCNRELSCGDIGPNALWLDLDACRKDVRQTMTGYLASMNCDTGVDAYSLAACVDSLRNGRCDEAGATVQRVRECRAATLCP